MRLIQRAASGIPVIVTSAHAPVIDLALAREARMMGSYRAQAKRALARNREALTHLFHTGDLFDPAGAFEAEGLLETRRHLQRLVMVLDELSGEGPVPAARSEARVRDLFAELEALVGKMDRMADRAEAALCEI
jgi:hypothetical protein